MPYDVYAKADGRNREYRRGGLLFFTDEPVRLEEEHVTEELRSDPWLFLIPVAADSEAEDPEEPVTGEKADGRKRGGGR